MIASREQIYTALAAQLKETASLISVSRVYRPPSDYSSAVQLPAGCLDELNEDKAVPIYGVDGTYTLAVDFWVYLLAPQLSQVPGQETIVPVTALNNVLDALDAAFPSETGGVPNTLGGLVQSAFIVGKILKVSGVGSGNLQLSIARVPIQIFNG